MKIALFDIDDTLTYETEFMKKYAPDFLRKYGLENKERNPYGYNLIDVFELKKQFADKGYSAQDALTMSKRIENKFWNTYFFKYNLTKCREGAKEIINELKNSGYEIHLLSLRGKQTIENQNIFKVHIQRIAVLTLTKFQLWRNGIKYDKLTLVSNRNEKIEYINHYNPVIVVEDQTEILKNIAVLAKKICIVNSHNENIELPDIIKVHDYVNDRRAFLDAAGQSSGENIPKALKKKTLKVRCIDLTQKTVTAVAKWYFIFKYKPIVLGKEKIFLKGGIIFVGNHRNKLDPVMITITSRRQIHWAALLRMFQGKEDLFSVRTNRFICNVSAFFITAMGALPIARPNDENFMQINKKTLNILEEILLMGCADGFFPEGTINRKPNEVDILPLKSSRIFQMAVDTGSYVQPFSIIWTSDKKDLKRLRPIIIYSYPINTYNRGRKEIKEIWLKAVQDNIHRAKYYEQK